MENISEENMTEDNMENENDINIYEKSHGVILTEETIGDVDAEIVKMANSSARNIKAKNSVRIEQSLVKNIITQQSTSHQTFNFKTSAEKVSFENAIVGLNDSNETVCDRTVNLVSVSDITHATTINSMLSYSAETDAEEIKSLVFIGKKVNGNVTTLLNSKTAAIAGAVCGLIYFTLKSIFDRD